VKESGSRDFPLEACLEGYEKRQEDGLSSFQVEKVDLKTFTRSYFRVRAAAVD
jgi:hypothetical protein